MAARPRQAGRGRGLFGAFLGALAIEAAAAAGVVAWVGQAALPPAIKEEPLKVSLVTLPPAPPAPAPAPAVPVVAPPPEPPPPAPPPEPAPPPPEPAPPPPPPDPPPPEPAPPPPEPPPPEPPPPQSPPKPKPKPKLVRPVKPDRKPPPDNAPHVELPDARPPSAPSVAPSASTDEMALFEGRVRQAVQRAVAYPMAARASHQAGRAQVGFTLTGGTVSEAALVKGSGFPVLDRAALAAVRGARYPAPPAALADRATRFLVWVQFQPPDDD